MDVYEVVKKLIGPIKPIGETQEDDLRFDNLKVMTSLVDKLLSDIDAIIPNRDSQASSMKRAGEFADKFFSSIGIEE